jgi:hypothetical protein
MPKLTCYKKTRQTASVNFKYQLKITIFGGGSISWKIEVIRLSEKFLVSKQIEFKDGKLFMRAKKRGIIRIE